MYWLSTPVDTGTPAVSHRLMALSPATAGVMVRTVMKFVSVTLKKMHAASALKVLQD